MKLSEISLVECRLRNVSKAELKTDGMEEKCRNRPAGNGPPTTRVGAMADQDYNRGYANGKPFQERSRDVASLNEEGNLLTVERKSNTAARYLTSPL